MGDMEFWSQLDDVKSIGERLGIRSHPPPAEILTDSMSETLGNQQ